MTTIRPSHFRHLACQSKRGVMLRDLHTLNGSSVTATDGKIGAVRDFLFDDESWTVRYLVVDVGNLLKRRDVVLATAAVQQLDWTSRTLRVNFTREQVRHSPDVDTEQPVSRQQEIAMRDYFGWFAYWVDEQVYGALRSMPVGVQYPTRRKADSHLRSAWYLRGYTVSSGRSEIGHLESYIMDEASWHVGYLDVKAGDWLQSRSLLVPTDCVESISWPHHRISLSPSRRI